MSTADDEKTRNDHDERMILTQAAEQGDANARCILGFMFASGHGVERDYAEAVKWHTLAAEQGDARSQFSLGNMYAEELGVERSFAESANWFMRAAEQGHAVAQFELCFMYAHGIGMEKDDADAAKWFERAQAQDFSIDGTNFDATMEWDKKEDAKWRMLAEEMGFEEAYRLGVMYAERPWVKRNNLQAMKWLGWAAEQGYAPAQVNLGILFTERRCAARYDLNPEKWGKYSLKYHVGKEGICFWQTYERRYYKWLYKQDVNAARKWFGLAAEQGNADAQYNIGAMYDDFGFRLEKDYAESVKWYRLAAEQGHAMAQHSLGVKYKCGEGVEQNTAEALKLLLLAAGQGNARAESCLGRMYARGEGVERDESEAKKWYALAAKHGDFMAKHELDALDAIPFVKNHSGDPGDVDAARLYIAAAIEGNEKAVEWVRLAAERGNAEAQFTLGYYTTPSKSLFRRDMESARNDDSEAIEWLRRAGEQGHMLAQFQLGRAYLWGRKVERDYAEAAKWYRLAAEQGHRESQYFVGSLYYGGKGVNKDRAEGLRWLRLAAEQGHEQALMTLEKWRIAEKYGEDQV